MNEHIRGRPFLTKMVGYEKFLYCFLVFSRLKSISFFAVSREEFMLEGSNMVQIEDFFSSPYGWEGILQAIKNKLFWHTYKVSV